MDHLQRIPGVKARANSREKRANSLNCFPTLADNFTAVRWMHLQRQLGSGLFSMLFQNDVFGTIYEALNDFINKVSHVNMPTWGMLHVDTISMALTCPLKTRPLEAGVLS
jgi:hypothetical protein